jgi:hypothetical protein
MAYTRTMSQLIGLCQRRADKETDEHVDSDEWKEMISELYGELHGAVAETGARYFESEQTITATGAASYALPSDHLSTIGVDRVLDSSGSRSPLDQLMVQEGPWFAGVTGHATSWALTAGNIALYPNPISGTYQHLYVPQPADLSSASLSTSVDLINVHGLKMLVWGVASIALHKGEANQQRCMAEREAAKGELIAWAVHRALTMPRRRIVMGDEVWRSPADFRTVPT